MAVVYAVMLESGFNRTEFGKGILGACFVNDLGTVIALGLIFAPFTYRTVVFLGVSVVLVALLPLITTRLTARYGNRTAAIRTKWILLVLCCLGALALWSGSEAVLPAYLAGMVLAKTVGRDHFLYPPPADADDRLPHAVLLHPGRFAGFAAGAGRGAAGVSVALPGQIGIQDLRPLSGGRHVPARTATKGGTTR